MGLFHLGVINYFNLEFIIHLFLLTENLPSLIKKLAVKTFLLLAHLLVGDKAFSLIGKLQIVV